jgi:eukaryotic-like serine/threonine-protein kinase
MKRDTPGTILAGKYELLRIAGQGGMAIVWRAVTRGPQGERPLAVKRMLVGDRDLTFAELFREEARVGLGLRHENIVQVLDFGASEADGYYLVMEWVEGIDLLDFMRAYHADGRHMPWQAIAAVASRVCHGLRGAHEKVGAGGKVQPVIHRDLTPGNILLGIDGAVKIADFGLARATDRGSMTMPNTIKGKLSYTAPEVASGEPASVRSDIFGLGVTLWECLAARKLFAAKSNLEVIQAIYRWDVPDLSQIRRDLPADVVKAVTQAIARDPEQRYASARSMGQAFDKVLSRDPVDGGRLGATVQAARKRLSELDAAPTIEEVSALTADLVSVHDGAAGPPRRKPPPPPAAAARKPKPPPLPSKAQKAAPQGPLLSALRGPVRPAPRARTAIKTPQVPGPVLRSIPVELSLSDLFDAKIESAVDASESPASRRMAGPRPGENHLLDHASAWDLSVVEKGPRKPG